MYYGHVLPSYVTKATSFLLEGGLLCVACIVVSGWGLGGGVSLRWVHWSLLVAEFFLFRLRR